MLNCTNDLEVPNYHEAQGLNYLRIAVNDNDAWWKIALGKKEAGVYFRRGYTMLH